MLYFKSCFDAEHRNQGGSMCTTWLNASNSMGFTSCLMLRSWSWSKNLWEQRPCLRNRWLFRCCCSNATSKQISTNQLTIFVSMNEYFVQQKSVKKTIRMWVKIFNWWNTSFFIFLFLGLDTILTSNHSTEHRFCRHKLFFCIQILIFFSFKSTKNEFQHSSSNQPTNHMQCWWPAQGGPRHFVRGPCSPGFLLHHRPNQHRFRPLKISPKTAVI